MDDHQALDDLAALFLSGPEAAPAPDAPGLTGPGPIRLRPKPAVDAAGPAVAAPPDAEPRLRLAGDGPPVAATDPGPGSDPPARTGGGPPAASPAVEAVLLGNLPGLADAWLPQYAQLLADRDGPVLLLHPVDGSADPLLGGAETGTGFELEWIGPGGSAAAARLAGLDADAALVDRVGSLLSGLAHPPATLLVHAGAGEAAARFAGVADWAVLSGADPVAVQAAAAAVRRVVAAAPAVGGGSVGLVVMGSGEDADGPAAAGLDAALLAGSEDPTAGGPLRHPVEPLGSLPRMNPVTRTALGFAPDDVVGGGWDALLDRLATPPVSGPAPASAAPAPPAAEPPTPAAAPAPAPAVRVPAPSLPSTPAPAAPAGVLDRLAAAVPAGPRLEPIEPGCPGQPTVQLALDDAGRLHLIARHAWSEAHPHPREAVLALRDAAAWAREHHAWLAAANPGRPVDATEPVPHLLTDRPDLALGLAQQLGPALRLYLTHSELCFSLS